MVSRLSPQQWFARKELQAVQPDYYAPAPMQLSPQEQFNNSMLLLAILFVLIIIAVLIAAQFGYNIGKRKG